MVSPRRQVRQAIVVLVAILLVTATFTPALAVSSSSSTSLSRQTGSDRVVNLPTTERTLTDLFSTAPSLTPRQNKTAAVQIIEDLDANGRPNLQRARDRSQRLVNGTLTEYRDPTRVENEAVFDNDSQAVQSLTQFSGTDQESQVERATTLIVEADNETAAVAIRDAKRALAQTRDRIDSPGPVRAAEAHIENAERAYDRGRRILENSGPFAQRVRSRARAIRQFATAWRQAQLAIDRLDQATSPEVLIESRLDPPRNGTNSTTRRIVGQVNDVQAYQLENATVRVNGGPAQNVSLNASTAPAENATFTTNVTFTQRNTTINVTVIDAGPAENKNEDQQSDDNDKDDRNEKGGPPEDAGPPGDRESENKNEDDEDDEEENGLASGVGTDVLRLDGDGLPDRYERSVTETQPLDPDSDSARTTENEASDQVLDGGEDFDNDTLATYFEFIYSTDPFVKDTDGDGLGDRFEIRYPVVNPTVADTNDDGTPDGAGDPDGDGLVNRAEQDNATDPRFGDPDRDGLNDSAEVRIGTDPFVSDTDGDGLSDKAELRLGTDPLVPDTDSDGILDGNETFTTTARNATQDVTVQVTGNGDAASGVEIGTGDRPQFQRSDAIQNASVSPIVEINSDAPIQNATIEIGYNGSRVTNESDLAVFRYNDTLGTFVPLNSSVDPETNTISTTTSEFSTFVVFRISNWANNFNATVPSGRSGGDDGAVAPVDVAFILDSSGSMDTNDPQDLRLAGAKRFVSALIPGDRAAVVDFDSDARVTQPLTTDLAAVNQSIDQIDSFGGTDVGEGLFRANEEFDRASNDSRAKIAILLTDGRTFSSRFDSRTQAQRAAENNITIYTIGFGNPNRVLLQDIADTTGGNFTFVNDVSDLPEVFSRIAENATGPTDSDGDGLSDTLEREGIPTGDGDSIKTDPSVADTDGDGVPDGEEIGRLVETYEFGQFYRVRSNPNATDSDADGLDDFEERQGYEISVSTEKQQTIDFFQALQTNGSSPVDVLDERTVVTDPRDPNSDDDGLSDGREFEAGTDASHADTDGDRVEDDVELRESAAPTLFDAQPPTVNVRYANFFKPSFSFTTTYQIGFEAADLSGIKTVKALKDGAEQFTCPSSQCRQSLSGFPTEPDFNIEFKTRGLGTIVDALDGASVKVQASDRYDNTRRTVALERTNFYGTVAGELGSDTIFAEDIAFGLGALSGFTVGAGGTLSGLKQILDDPTVLIDSVRQLISLLRNLGLLDDLIQRLPDQIKQKQQLNNPYDPDRESELYDEYRTAWYGGYIGFFAIEIGLGATGTVNKVNKFRRLLSELRENPARLRALLRAADSIDSPTTRTRGRISSRLRDRGVDISAPQAFTRLRTAGRQARVLSRYAELDRDRIDAFDGNEQQLTSLLVRGDRDAVDTINSLDTSDARTLSQLLEDSGPAFTTKLGRALRKDDVSTADVDRLLRSYDGLDSGNQQKLRSVLAAGDANTLAGASKLSEGRLLTVLNDDASTRRKAAALRGVKRVTEQRGDLGATPGGRGLALRYLLRNGDEDTELLSLCSSPCLQDRVDDLVENIDNFDREDADILLDTYRQYDNEVDDPELADVDALQSRIERLAAPENDVDGLAKAIRMATGEISNFKGLEGETRAAVNILDNPDRDIEELSVNVDNSRGNSEIDVDLGPDESIAIESKNIDYDRSDFLNRKNKNELIEKLEVISEERDTIVIVSRTDNPEDNEFLQEVVEQANTGDTEVMLMNYDDLKSI